MAGKLILMHQVRLIIQLHGKGQGKRAIARHLSMSRNTVRRYLDRIEQSGYSLDELEALDDAALRLVCEPAPAEGPTSPDSAALSSNRPGPASCLS